MNTAITVEVVDNANTHDNNNVRSDGRRRAFGSSKNKNTAAVPDRRHARGSGSSVNDLSATAPVENRTAASTRQRRIERSMAGG